MTTHQFPRLSLKGHTVEYKTYSFLVKSIDQKQGIATGIASPTTNVDRQKDMVDPGAYATTLAEAEQRMQSGRRFMYATLWMHNPEQPTGGVIAGQEIAEGLEVTMKYDISTNAAGHYNNPTAAMVFSAMDVGYADELSIGYLPVKYVYDKQGVRHLQEIDLLEISNVTMLFAANPDALVPASGVKSSSSRADKRRRTMTQERKDFNDLYQAAQAADCLEDWGDLVNTLTAAMMQLFCMGDQPAQDMAACLEQFGQAVMTWVDKGMQSGLAEYLSSRGYGGDATPSVPYALRVGESYMSRSDSTAHKVGARNSASDQKAIDAHVAMVSEHAGKAMKAIKAIQQAASSFADAMGGSDGSDGSDADQDGKEPDDDAQDDPKKTVERRVSQKRAVGKDISLDDLAALLM